MVVDKMDVSKSVKDKYGITPPEKIAKRYPKGHKVLKEVAVAKRLIFKKLSVPNYKILNDGNLKIENGAGGYVTVSKGQNVKTYAPEANIVDSNILDPKMFEDNSCGSKFSLRKGKIRSTLRYIL